MKNKILTPKFFEHTFENTNTNLVKKIEKKLKFPVVLKPINEGSSVNVFICTKTNIHKKLKFLKNYKKIIIEEFIPGRVKSPIIGTAYLAPEPGAKKFVKIGDKVKKGQTIMIVEAMKTMNHVPSTSDGEVKKILVEDGQPVEFGQTLVLLK